MSAPQSHYSVLKGAHWLGMGTSSVVKVATDKDGRLLPGELRDAILEARRRGVRPCMVNATVGTTVLGAIDPLDEIADLCEEMGVWMHVDVSVAVLHADMRMGK